MPGDPGELVVTNACAYYLRARGYGCNGHPAFPAPPWGSARSLLRVAPRPPFRGGKHPHNSGATRRENAGVFDQYGEPNRRRPPPGRANARPMTGSGAVQYFEASAIEWKSWEVARARHRANATGGPPTACV